MQQCIQISTRINSSSVHTYIFVCSTLRVSSIRIFILIDPIFNITYLHSFSFIQQINETLWRWRWWRCWFLRREICNARWNGSCNNDKELGNSFANICGVETLVDIDSVCYEPLWWDYNNVVVTLVPSCWCCYLRLPCWCYCWRILNISELCFTLKGTAQLQHRYTLFRYVHTVEFYSLLYYQSLPSTPSFL